MSAAQKANHTYEIVHSIYKKKDLSLPERVVIDGLKEHEANVALKQMLPELIHSDPVIKKIWNNAKEGRFQVNLYMRSLQYFLDEWSEGRIHYDGILPWAQFRAEVKLGLTTILEETGPGETIAVFTSGGTISSIIGEALEMNVQKRVAALNFSIRNTSYTSFFYSNGSFNLLGCNEIPHLPDDMITFV